MTRFGPVRVNQREGEFRFVKTVYPLPDFLGREMGILVHDRDASEIEYPALDIIFDGLARWGDLSRRRRVSRSSGGQLGLTQRLGTLLPFSLTIRSARIGAALYMEILMRDIEVQRFEPLPIVFREPRFWNDNVRVRSNLLDGNLLCL